MSVRMAPGGRQLALLSDKVKVTQAEIKSPLGQNALQTKRLPTGVLSIPPPQTSSEQNDGLFRFVF